MGIEKHEHTYLFAAGSDTDRPIVQRDPHTGKVHIYNTPSSPSLPRAREAGTLRPWATTAVGFSSTEEHDTDATRLYL